jgi:hypothetical protein
MYIYVGLTTDPNLQHSGSKGGWGRMGNNRFKRIRLIIRIIIIMIHPDYIIIKISVI